MILTVTPSGTAFDLSAPKPESINLDVDIIEPLSKISRWNGGIQSGPFSVAQHCVMGADAIRETYGSTSLALHFLLHDAHEAYIGDISTPTIMALGCKASAEQLKSRIDAAIYARLGLRWPLTSSEAAFVRAMDQSMAKTEQIHFRHPTPIPLFDGYDQVNPIRLKGKATVWTWPRAAEEYRTRLTRWHKSMSKAA